MTREQRLAVIRQELALNERLAQLLVEHAKDFADTAMRKLYNAPIDAGFMVRQVGLAEGVEMFVADLTKPNKAARSDDRR